jgi:hypothetical protein
MRNLFKSIEYVEHAMSRGLDNKAAPREASKPRLSIRAWRAPAPATDVRYPLERVFQPKKKENPMTRNPMTQLTVAARAMKITILLDAAAVAALPVFDGEARCQLIIGCEGKNYTSDIATKSLRKARATIVANGVENVFCMVQGKLKGNEIIEAGLVAQVKKTADGSQVA